MADLDKAHNLLGMANRTRKLTLGMSVTQESLRAGRTILLLLAADLSENAAKKVSAVADEKKTPILRAGSKQKYGELFGRVELGIIGIEDHGFAKAIKKALQ